MLKVNLNLPALSPSTSDVVLALTSPPRDLAYLFPRPMRHVHAPPPYLAAPPRLPFHLAIDWDLS